MVRMNRRQFVAAPAVLTVAASQSATRERNLLSGTYPLDKLSAVLIREVPGRPFPKPPIARAG
jgi:hypothetical protein